jgi:hypothetical protein
VPKQLFHAREIGFHVAGNGPAIGGSDGDYISREENMRFIQTATRRFGIAGELLSFFVRNKRWWMLPTVIAVLLIGVLLILAQSSVIAPFIYTLF